jgi:1,6-anhydro-N-acetylmuramate kinase
MGIVDHLDVLRGESSAAGPRSERVQKAACALTFGSPNTLGDDVALMPASADHDFRPGERETLPAPVVGDEALALHQRPAAALDLDRELAELDLEARAQQLVDRGLAAERLAAQLLREEAHAVQAHRLDAHVRAGDPPADAGILGRRPAAAARRKSLMPSSWRARP